MSKGIRYYSFLEATGYGAAAIAYIRALLNAGIQVQWVRLRRTWDATPQPLPDTDESVFFRAAAGDVGLADLAQILRHTSAPIGHDTVLCHCPPEYWPHLFERGKRNVGYTVWEADRPPPHWPPIFDRADRILVPCRLNCDAFVATGTRAPVRIVPHIRRHVWNTFTPDERCAARTRFGIPENHFIFYSIGDWYPRKALGLLLETYARAFTAADPVTLLLKTSEFGYGTPPLYPREATSELARMTIERCAMALGHGLPNLCLLPLDDLSGCEIDLLHELGDCYVSLAHGEGWALGAFDAATRGTPVVMTGWGGQLDYLGPSWSGAIPYGLGSVPIWPPERPSYFSSQRWAHPDTDAAGEMLRAVYRDGAAARENAMALAAGIAHRYAEPVIAALLLHAIDD